MMDSNHDIVPTLRMFDGLIMGQAADEIERLRQQRELVDREIRRSRRFYFHTLKNKPNTALAQIFNALLEANGTFELDATKNEAREQMSRIPELKE
jgi:hypothetical protein